MREPNLKKEAWGGIIWGAIERFSSQGVQFLFSIILARLLTPKDYGIIAMPLIFLMIAQVFIDSGFANALIRKPDLSEKDLSTAFIFNIAVGIICYGFLFLASPFIAAFYDIPVLSDILKVTSLSILFNSFCTVQQAILTKKFDFKLQARVSIISVVGGGLAGVFMAYSSYGVWSLAVSQALTAFMRVLLFWRWSKWRPKEKWDTASFTYLWNYGSKLLFAGLIDVIYQNVYPLIIGKYYNAANLGYYTRAQQLARFPVVNVYGIIRRVSFPLLSEIQYDIDRLSIVFIRILRISVFIIFPLMCFIAGTSKPIILVLLSEKWSDSIIILQLLSFAMMWRPIDSLNLNLLIVKARTNLFLKLEIIKKILGGLILVGTIYWGVIAICIGYVCYSIMEIIIDTYYSGKLYHLGLCKQLRCIVPTIIISSFILVATYYVSEITSNYYVSIIINSLITLFVIIGFCKIFKMEEYREILSLVKRKQ